MLVKNEARILIFPGTDFHFPSTSVPPGTFLGSGITSGIATTDSRQTSDIKRRSAASLAAVVPAARTCAYLKLTS